MTGLQTVLSRVCNELGLDIDYDTVVKLDDRSSIKAVGHFPQLGAPNGMLIFCDINDFWPHHKAIRAAQYGFSVLEERQPDCEIDIISFKNIFSEWGWTGDQALKPSWMK
jgi:hypothetical protein